MKVFKKVCGIIFSIYGFVIFLVIMFILFPFVIIASFFGRIKGGNMIYSICRLWTDCSLFFWGIRHKNYFDAPKSTDHAVVFVFNHISYIDIPLLLKVFRRQPIRVLGKAEMGKIPVFGYIYRRAAVSVQRSSPEARAKSVATLKSMLRQNISVVIAPEGTFNTTHKPLKEFYDGAFKIAIETQTSVQPVIFLDAYDRLNYKSIFSLTPGRSRAVFLEEIEVDGYTMEDVELLKEKVYGIMEAALIKYDASWIKSN
jgi:1-acyl-sn-glycerol-3-phosphate acyltransferase